MPVFIPLVDIAAVHASYKSEQIKIHIPTFIKKLKTCGKAKKNILAPLVSDLNKLLNELSPKVTDEKSTRVQNAFEHTAAIKKTIQLEPLFKKINDTRSELDEIPCCYPVFGTITPREVFSLLDELQDFLTGLVDQKPMSRIAPPTAVASPVISTVRPTV